MTLFVKNYEIKQHTKMFIIAFFDALIAQFYYDNVPFEFKFSISVAILPVYYYFDRSLNPIKTGLYVTTVGLAFRTLTQANALGLYQAFWQDFNFMYFDILYGIIMYFLFYKVKDAGMSRWVIVVVLADTLGNIVEFSSRHGLNELLNSNVVSIIFFVAVVRVLIALAIVTFMKQYTLLIRKDEHEIRYKELVMLTSDLKSEAYYMQKNIDFIERVMSDAYSLYSDFDEVESDVNKKLALKIATEVHEIKKNYSRVVEGLAAITDKEITEDTMRITTLLKILRTSLSKYLDVKESKIRLNVSGHSSEAFEDHYHLMSVLRNLVNNAIEAIGLNNNGRVDIAYSEEGDFHLFSVSDTGGGIKEEDLKFIFEAGFSTKFNEATGDICRGVGLALVKQIVEEQLDGRIEVESIVGLGTTFKVYIRK